MAPKAKRRAALYLRVSTDKQTVENQRQGLIEAAKQRGWTVLSEYDDPGLWSEETFRRTAARMPKRRRGGRSAPDAVLSAIEGETNPLPDAGFCGLGVGEGTTWRQRRAALLVWARWARDQD